MVTFYRIQEEEIPALIALPLHRKPRSTTADSMLLSIESVPVCVSFAKIQVRAGREVANAPFPILRSPYTAYILVFTTNDLCSIYKDYNPFLLILMPKYYRRKPPVPPLSIKSRADLNER